MEHCHQQLSQDDDHHNVVGAYDHGPHEWAQLLCVADAGDKECNMRQGEDVPEQGIAGPHKPVKQTKLLLVREHVSEDRICSSKRNSEEVFI